MNFLTKNQVLCLQHDNIERFGGAHGMRDEGAFESALMAAENRFYYEDADVVKCAATYGYHLSQAHAFIDGNKRVAAAATTLFLAANGQKLNLTNDDIIEAFLRLASSEMTRDELEIFLRDRTT